MVRALASHHCGPGSNPGVDAICGLSLLLILSLALRGFFSGYSGFPLSLKTNTFKFQFDLERTDVSTSSYELLSAPWVNKLQFTIYNLFIARKPSRFVGRRCLLKALNGTGTKLVLCEIEIIFSPFIEADLVIKVKLLYSSLTSSHYRGKKI